MFFGASSFIAGLNRGIEDLSRHKETWWKAANGEIKYRFFHTTFELTSPLPFASSSVYAPEYDFFGNLIIPKTDQRWNTAAAYSGRIKGKDIFGISAIDYIEEHPIESYFSSIKAIDLKKIGSIAFHTCINQSENTFFRPSWVSSMLPEVRKMVLDQFSAEMPGSTTGAKPNISMAYDIIRIPASRQFHSES